MRQINEREHFQQKYVAVLRPEMRQINESGYRALSWQMDDVEAIVEKKQSF